MRVFSLKIISLTLVLSLFNLKSMAQSKIVFENKEGVENIIFFSDKNAFQAANILKSNLDKTFITPFLIQNTSEANSGVAIHLVISNSKNNLGETSFVIKSDDKSIYLIASNSKLLRYAVYTLLEEWGFRKFTSKDLYIPKFDHFEYPKNTEMTHRPSFEYRVLFYPDAFDEDFRDWHKLDWHLDDFSIWGHSFERLISAKEFFKTNPEFFAFYEGKRRYESLCMTNENGIKNVIKKMTQIINKNPEASFISISQNDDAVFCECDKCKLLNEKHGGAQGSLYFFLNKIAKHFPKNKIVTLAYQQTFKAPVNLKIQPNIYPLICPIDLNRGKSIPEDNANKSFLKTVQNWNNVTSNLYLWDYTVQFSNYLSPFPNISTFADNYKFFKKNNVKGLFVQGYADVPGDFSELRQYLLAKLLWNTEIDIEATTDDFLRGYYGKAAPAVKEYLDLLKENQKKSDRILDIYSGPIQNRNTFLTPEAMDKYDQILDDNSHTFSLDSIVSSRINKLRLALEFVFFEQSKFYGAEKHGMFFINSNGLKEVKPGLNQRVKQFVQQCNNLGIYELSEDGISPNTYYENWIEITKNTVEHLGENLEINFLSPPSNEYVGKGSATLVDGLRGHKDFNINWVGWYGNNPEIEIVTKGLDFNKILINFLDNQRNWILMPKNIRFFGFLNDKWVMIQENQLAELIENPIVNSRKIEVFDTKFSGFEKIKIVIQNQTELPSWRKRKNKKPMVMIDEIELYKQ